MIARRATWLLAAGASLALLGGCTEYGVPLQEPVMWTQPAPYPQVPAWFWHQSPQQYAPPDPAPAAAAPRQAARKWVNTDDDDDQTDASPAPPAPVPAAPTTASNCVGWWRVCHFF